MKRKQYYTAILLFALGLLCYQQLHARITATDVGMSTEVSKKKKSTRTTTYKATLNELALGVVLYVCQQSSWKYDLNQHIITAFVVVCIVGWLLADYERDHLIMRCWDWKKVVGFLATVVISAVAFSLALVDWKLGKWQRMAMVLSLGLIGLACKFFWSSVAEDALYPLDGQAVPQLFTEALSVGTLLFSLWQKKTDEDVRVKQTVGFIAFTILGLIHNLQALPKASLEKRLPKDSDVFGYLWNIRHAFFRHLYSAYPVVWLFMAGERSAHTLGFSLLLCIATNRAYQRIKVTRPRHYLPRITAKYCFGNMILDGIMGVAFPYFCLSGTTFAWERLCFSVFTHVYFGWVIDLHTSAIAAWCAPHLYAPLIISLLRMCLLAPTTYHIFEPSFPNFFFYLALIYFYGFMADLPEMLRSTWEKVHQLLNFKHLLAHQVFINVAAICASLLVGMIHVRHNKVDQPLLVLSCIGFLTLLLSTMMLGKAQCNLRSSFVGHGLVVGLLTALEKNDKGCTRLLQLMVPYLLLYWLLDHLSFKLEELDNDGCQRAVILYLAVCMGAMFTLIDVANTKDRKTSFNPTLARFVVNVVIGVLIALVVDVVINLLKTGFNANAYLEHIMVGKVVIMFFIYVIVLKKWLPMLAIGKLKMESKDQPLTHPLNVVLLLLSCGILCGYLVTFFEVPTGLQKVGHLITQVGYSNLIGCCMVVGLFVAYKEKENNIKAYDLIVLFLTNVVRYVGFYFLIRKVVGDGSIVYELQPNSFMIYEKIPFIKQTHEYNVSVLWVALWLVCGLLWLSYQWIACVVMTPLFVI